MYTGLVYRRFRSYDRPVYFVLSPTDLLVVVGKYRYIQYTGLQACTTSTYIPSAGMQADMVLRCPGKAAALVQSGCTLIVDCVAALLVFEAAL